MTEILITDRPRTGRSALLWRDSDEVWKETEGTPTVPVEYREPIPPLPVIAWQDGPHAIPEPLPSWPLMTRVRLRLAAWLIGI